MSLLFFQVVAAIVQKIAKVTDDFQNNISTEIVFEEHMNLSATYCQINKKIVGKWYSCYEIKKFILFKLGNASKDREVYPSKSFLTEIPSCKKWSYFLIEVNWNLQSCVRLQKLCKMLQTFL